MISLDDLKPGDVIRDTRKTRTFRTVDIYYATGKIWGWKGLFTRKPNGTPDIIRHLGFWEKVN